MKIRIYHHSGNIKRILIFVAIVLIFALLRYSQNIVNRLREDSTNLVRFYAEFYAEAVTDETSQDFSFIFDIIRRISIPIVISDKDFIPTGWKNIRVEGTELTDENIKKVENIMREMDLANERIPLEYNKEILGYIHYGDTKLIKRLKMLPFVEIAVVGLFIFLGYMGFHVIRSSEKRSIWVGMAKETAHQLGTPLSSMMGWLELLKIKDRPFEEVNEMSKDLERLKKITTRFSKIGSVPTVKLTSLNSVVEDAVEYYKRRLPQLDPKVNLNFVTGRDFHAKINPDLFSWAIENLIKNALDAVPEENGIIELSTKLVKKGKFIAIDVMDNGKGISKKDRRNIFRPGYSTKKRGWGLGLSLTQRIVKDYHYGKIFVKESRPGEKTVMCIIIRRDEEN